VTLTVTDDPPDRPAWVSETIRLVADERGVSLIALRLGQGQEGGSTGQPRPAASAVTRPGISALAEKAASALRRLRAEFAHLRALDQGTATAI
jgi:hypothetical protein